MDSILSEFIAHTSADPGLATDLLESHDWRLQSALEAYYVMKGVLPGEVPLAETDKLSVQRNIYTTRVTANGESSTSSRPPLRKLQAFEFDPDEFEKKLSRGFSRTTDNFDLVLQARKEFEEDLKYIDQDINSSVQNLEIPEYSFSLPDFSVYSLNLKEYLERDLIETATLVSLENAGRLNWWFGRKIGRKLWPLSTTGDGNCLLHAASLGIWGFHDRLLTLRKALHSVLTNSMFTDAFYRRWRWQTMLQNKKAGLIFSEKEWENEWKNLLKISSSEPRQSSRERSKDHLSGGSSSNSNDTYESLEELHILALSHVLKRAIVVIADTVLKDVAGRPLAPIPFGGIYLPLGCDSGECHKTPLCLTFDAAHFSALVPMDGEGLPAIVPLTDASNHLLPLQFVVDPGPSILWSDPNISDSQFVAKLDLSDKEKLSLLGNYLEVNMIEVEDCPVLIKNANSKRTDFYGSDDSFSGNGISCAGGKSKKNKLQLAAQQFGRSMSKKLKNIGNIARKGGSLKSESSTSKQNPEELQLQNMRTLSVLPSYVSPSESSIDDSLKPRQMALAILNIDKKHEHQKKLIENYLSDAILRYERIFNSPPPFRPTSHMSAYSYPIHVQTSPCINLGCNMMGLSTNHYLCSACHMKQRNRELEMENYRLKQLSEGPVVVSGRSSFYTEIDQRLKDSVKNMPVVNHLVRAVGQRNPPIYDEHSLNGRNSYNGVPLEYRNDYASIHKTVRES